MERQGIFIGSVVAACATWLFLYSIFALDDFFLTQTTALTSSDIVAPTIQVYTVAAVCVALGYAAYAVAPVVSTRASVWGPWVLLVIASGAWIYLHFTGEMHTFRWPLLQIVASQALAIASICLVILLLSDVLFRTGGPFYADRSIVGRALQVVLAIGAITLFVMGAKFKSWYDFRPRQEFVVMYLASYSCAVDGEPSGFTIALQNENLTAYRCGRTAALVHDRRRNDTWYFVTGGSLCTRDVTRSDGRRSCVPIDELQLTSPTLQSIRFSDSETGGRYQTSDPPNPEQATAAHNLGLEAYRRGEFDLAIVHFNNAISRRPNYASAFNNRGNAYRRLGRHREAIQDFSHAISLGQAFPSPEDIVALASNNRALSYEDTGDVNRALANFDAAIQRKPDYADAYSNRGYLKLEFLDDTQGAMEDFDAAIRIVPRHGIAHRYRGRAQMRLENYESAIRDYDVAAEALDDPESHNDRCWARAVDGRELEVAREACNVALVGLQGTFRADVLDSRGLVSLKQGRFREAWSDYNSAVQIERQSGFLFGRGLAAQRLGRSEDAEQDFGEALQLDPSIERTYRQRGVGRLP